MFTPEVARKLRKLLYHFTFLHRKTGNFELFLPLILNYSLTFRLFYKKKVVSWSVHSSLSSFLYSLNQVPCALKITLSQYSDFIKSFTLNLYSHFQTLMIKSHVARLKLFQVQVSLNHAWK